MIRLRCAHQGCTMTSAVRLDDDGAGHLPPGWGYGTHGPWCPWHRPAPEQDAAPAGIGGRILGAVQGQGGER